MKVKNLLAYAFFIIVFSSLIFAQCPPDCQEGFDIKTSDYSQITNWEGINVNEVPVDRISELDLSKLLDTQINTLTTDRKDAIPADKLVDHLERLDNLQEFNGAIDAVRNKYEVSVEDFGKTAVIKNGVLEVENGKFVFSGKNSWKIKVDQWGEIRVLEPAEINEKSVSDNDKFTLQELTTFSLKDGRKIRLSDVSFENGESYVKKESEALINGMSISGAEQRVDIFFEQPKKEPEGNYLVLVEGSVKLGSAKDGAFIIELQPGNEMFHMLKREYSGGSVEWVPDERDTMSITLSAGDGLEVISRAEKDKNGKVILGKGKTPEIKHTAGGGKVIIETGRMAFKIEAGDFKWMAVTHLDVSSTDSEETLDLRNSVAFKLSSDGFEGDLITTSSNRFKFGSIVTSGGLRVTESIEDNSMKTIEDLRRTHTKIKFDIAGGFGLDYDEISANMAQTMDEWITNRGNVHEFIDQIGFNTIANAGSIGDGFLIIGERFVDPISPLFSSIELASDPSRDVETVIGGLEHEIRHEFDKKIIGYEKEDFSEERIAIDGISTKYTEIADILIDKARNDGKLMGLVGEMTVYGVDYDTSREGMGLMGSDFISIIQEMVDDNEYDAARKLLEKFHQRFKDVTGFNYYAIYPVPYGKGTFFGEVPTIGGEISELDLRREIAKNNEAAIKLVQLNYDAAVIPKKTYEKLMGTHCQKKSCGKCLYYSLTCKSRPKVTFYPKTVNK